MLPSFIRNVWSIPVRMAIYTLPYIVASSSVCPRQARQNLTRCDNQPFNRYYSSEGPSKKVDYEKMTAAEWKKKLTPEQYAVCREGATEPAFSGEYYYHKEAGLYTCAGCGAPLFSSGAKYESGSGWPSFYEPYKEQSKENIVEKTDISHGMVRTEVLCKQCQGHLGHVFPDGPEPTGLRYCINSLSLRFKPRDT